MKARLHTFTIDERVRFAVNARVGQQGAAKCADVRRFLEASVDKLLAALVREHELTITPPLPFDQGEPAAADAERTT